MKTSYAAQATDDNHSKKIMTKKLKKKISSARQDQYALIKKQINAMGSLHKNEGKQHIFSMQLTQLINTIPDAILFKNREGRKLITNQLTQSLFKQLDLDWYGKADITPSLVHKKIRTDPKHSRISLKSELRLALEKRQFMLYYQTQVDSARQMLGVEALLRWEHPQYGLIAPDHFIPIAQQSDLILLIDAWVLQTACEQLKLWQSDPLKQDLLLSVNISARQFSQPKFVEQLRRILEETGINATRLRLELTESLMLRDVPNTIKKMKALKLLGVRFSMDNFGTGYSSLSHLKKLPIDQLKIDQFLMRDIAIDSCDAMIVKTIIDMTNKLGINVIAGGVESEQQFACLKHLGCSSYQGYLFGKPMPLNEFEKLISQAAP
ncbi:MAG: EAL domain-containing protein [Methylobacter sp.]|nr:EAL domain-containing protein [Methylobacter sp.]